MKIPYLDPVSRSREYVLYSLDKRAEVVNQWLFKGQSHRMLDQAVLGLDPVKSRGYHSMGILHHLGLKKDFQGLFAGKTVAQAVETLSNDVQDFSRILEHLDTSFVRPVLDLASLKREEQAELSKAKTDSSENRLMRIAGAATKPKRIRVYSYTFRRNADIVAEALARASGVCEKCYSWGGGSGYWSHHMAVQIVNDTQIRYDENDLSYEHPYSMLKLVSRLPSDFFE